MNSRQVCLALHHHTDMPCRDPNRHIWKSELPVHHRGSKIREGSEYLLPLVHQCSGLTLFFLHTFCSKPVQIYVNSNSVAGQGTGAPSWPEALPAATLEHKPCSLKSMQPGVIESKLWLSLVVSESVSVNFACTLFVQDAAQPIWETITATPNRD
jgi:hypothetical protein